MSTTTTTTPPSPLRVLQRLGFRFRYAGAPTIACEVMDDQLAKDEADKTTALTQATALEKGMNRLRADTSAFLSDKESPGIIDQREARILAGEMIDLGLITNQHRRHLKRMV